MQIKLTQESLDWLERNQISLHSRFGIRLRPNDVVYFNDDLELEPYVGFHAGNVFCPIGFMSYTNSLVPPNISIGRYCSLAWGLDFPSYDHPLSCLSTSIFTHDVHADMVIRVIRDAAAENKVNRFVTVPQKSPVSIEHDVWIGQHAVLMAGVTVKTGSVVAAHSVVTRDVEPYAIVGGNPARLIRYRFDEPIIRALLELEWWNYKFTDFNDIDFSSVQNFIREFSRRKPGLPVYRPARARLAEMPALARSASRLRQGGIHQGMSRPL